MINIQSINLFNRGELVKNADFATENVEITFDRVWQTNDISVHHHLDLDGGGTAFGTRYREVIQSIYGDRKFSDIFEWCSGPGFIGFDLLSHGMCDHLWLGDIYQPALRAMDVTVNQLPTHYHNRVTSFHMQSTTDIPRAAQFDLIVSNPPHWNLNEDPFINRVLFNDRISADIDWAIHAEFFRNIKSHLKPNGIVLLQEQSYASGPDSFKTFAEEGGLKITNCYWEPEIMEFYYLELINQQ